MSFVLKSEVDQQRRLENLRALRRFLDEAFRVPGTKVRFGWDAIIGLVPWAGDVATALMACAIIVQSHQMRVPRIVQLRMLLNVGIDLVVGLLPLVGDVADVFWKSNTRNFALLERHAGAVQPPSRADWVFVVGILTAVCVMAALPVLLLSWALYSLGRGLF